VVSPSEIFLRGGTFLFWGDSDVAFSPRMYYIYMCAGQRALSHKKKGGTHGTTNSGDAERFYKELEENEGKRIPAEEIRRGKEIYDAVVRRNPWMKEAGW
jgi:hypothetical protein